MGLTLKEALAALASMYAEEGVTDDTELLDADGFAVSGFVRRKFDKDDKELNVKAGDVVIELDVIR